MSTVLLLYLASGKEAGEAVKMRTIARKPMK